MMFKKIEYELTVAMLNTVKVMIWVENDKLHYSKEILYRPGNTEKDVISPVSVEEFTKKIEALRIDTWKKNYQPQGYVVLDGESWEVQYEDTDGKKSKSSGDNAYPANWESFQELLTSVAGDVSID